MNSLEKQLQKDSANIRAKVSPELEARIRTAVRRTVMSARGGARAPERVWLAASLTGAAAALSVIAVLHWRSTPPDVEALQERFSSVPDYVAEVERALPLQAKTAELTAPLESELQNLRADLDKARENVERDLRFTF